MNFDEYLQEQSLKPDTIDQHRRYIRYFICWLSDESLHLSQVSYREVLDCADQLRREGRSIHQTNRALLALRYYFAYLAEAGPAAGNPAAGISLKGTVRSVPHDLLSKEELEALYQHYAVRDDRTHRNKVLIGLLVYQGLTRQELETLRPEHVRLREGKIQVPATAKSNGRILTLQPHQILDLQEYQLLVRSKLQNKSERLFTGRDDLENLKNTLLHLHHALRKINPKLKNAMQIRQSVITQWLKEKDLRTVQYMAGHKYVSSTERYQTSNLEDLKEALNKHHPLNK